MPRISSSPSGGREALLKVFQKGLGGPEVASSTNAYGTTIRRLVQVNDRGAIEVGYFYPGGNLSATPKVTTVIPKIFKQ